MNKTYLIFKHEFLHTIKRVGWIIMTLIVPVLALLGIGIMALVTTDPDPAQTKSQIIGYVDETGIFYHDNSQDLTTMAPFASKEKAKQALLNGKISEYIIIPANYSFSGIIQRFTLEEELYTSPATMAVIKNFLTNNLLRDKVPPNIIKLIVSPLQLEITSVTSRGEIALEQSSFSNLLIPGIFSLLLGLALMFGSTSLIIGLGEEKESRLIEVLFSSVSISQLLIGKVLAMGTAGLIQVLIWLITAPLLLNLASSAFYESMIQIHIPDGFLLLGIVYFILGYLLFAVLSIGIGAISNNAREGGQLSMFYTLFSFVPLWFLSLLIAFPNSSIWVVLTLFPITAPVQTMVRLGISAIPLWQIITSIALLVISVSGGLFLSIKIFRINMLMHGKRPGIAEIIHGMKYS